jgi:hypothetical protein
MVVGCCYTTTRWGSNGLYDSVSTHVGGLHAQRRLASCGTRVTTKSPRWELPRGPIVCVLAGMGIGKTIAIKATLRENM